MEPTTNNATSPQGARKRCPNCGGSNKFDATWCGQCLEKFEEDTKADSIEESYSTVVSQSNDSNGSADSEEKTRPLDDEEAAKWLSSLAADTLTGFKAVSRSPKTSDESNGTPLIQTSSVKTAPRSDVSSDGQGTFQVSEAGITWTCLRCDSINAMEESACTVCGTIFADAIKPEEDKGPPKDANKAAMWSLMMPGAGHAYLGMWADGVARAIISIWVVAVTIFSASQGGGQASVMSLMFGLVSTGLWVVSAHDAYREASGFSKLVLLKRKTFLYLVLGLLLLSIVMIFATAISAGG
jgi:hypothetical protein